MLNKILISIFLICSALGMKGQPSGKIREGEVSFISSENIYVRFSSTENMKAGDTLYFRKEQRFIPALIVTQTSSISCICKPFMDIHITPQQKVYAFISSPKIIPRQEQTNLKDTTKQQTAIQERPFIQKENKSDFISGRISLSSYSTLSGNSSDKNNTRFRYNLKLDVGNTQQTGLSAETYLMYTHKINQNVLPEGLRVYSLAVHYNLDNKLNLWLGRKINYHISNVGSIDGLQAEGKSKDFYYGIAAGTRPDYLDYSFNKNLFQYGMWLGHQHTNKTGHSVSSTMAFFEQNNHGRTDRRFAYLQHDNNLIKDLNLFISSEIDLYKIDHNVSVNSLSLTGFYLSLRYRLNRQLSINGSFDQRKNVIYYETFKSFGDSLYEAVQRQGLQFGVQYRPGNVLISFNSGHQFGSRDLKPTDYISGNLTFNKVPGLNGAVILNSNLIRTGYLTSQAAGIHAEKELIQGKLLTNTGYRFEQYKFLSGGSKLSQHIGELDLSYRIVKSLSLSLDVEKTFAGHLNYTNIYFNLTERF